MKGKTMSAMNQPKGYGYGSNSKEPSGVKASDAGGERKGMIKNGIAMGKADATGADKKFDGGRTSGVCYTHSRNGKM
jgi:hypothetical protein